MYRIIDPEMNERCWHWVWKVNVNELNGYQVELNGIELFHVRTPKLKKRLKNTCLK